jgi:hypothetical protein
VAVHRSVGNKERKLAGEAVLSYEHVRPEQEEGEKKMAKACHLVKAFFPIRLFFKTSVAWG